MKNDAITPSILDEPQGKRPPLTPREQDLLEENRLLRIQLDAIRADAFAKHSDQPLVIHGKRFQIKDKAFIAAQLDVSEDTFSKWVACGIMPQPFDPERREGNGRKVLKWDLYECIERFQSYRRN